MSRVDSVSLDELKFAMCLMDAAAKLKLPVVNPESKHVTIYDDQSGEATRISFPDTPFTRAIFALTQHFEFEKSAAIFQRIQALYHVSEQQKFSGWVRHDSESTSFDDAIIHAACKAKLRWGKTRFNAGEVVRLARSFAA